MRTVNIRATIGLRPPAYSRQQCKKLSQSEPARILKTNHSVIGKYERDEMKRSIEAATKLAAALEVSLDYLVGIAQMQVFDKGLLRRVEELASLSEQDREGILFALDGLLRDAKARMAYQ